jgi:hypothetical protein
MPPLAASAFFPVDFNNGGSKTLRNNEGIKTLRVFLSCKIRSVSLALE